MSATSRELVYQTLACENPARAPRQIWTLPIAEENHPAELAGILCSFPKDLDGTDGHCLEKAPTKGCWSEMGEYVDEWGCTFLNVHRGVIGEVKNPLIQDGVADRAKVHFRLLERGHRVRMFSRSEPLTNRGFTGVGNDA